MRVIINEICGKCGEDSHKGRPCPVSFWYSGKRYKLPDDCTAILELISGNQDRAAINDQTMLANVLLGAALDFNAGLIEARATIENAETRGANAALVAAARETEKLNDG